MASEPATIPLNEGSANYGWWVKASPTNSFGNKLLLEYSHSHSFMFHLQFLLNDNGKFEWL